MKRALPRLACALLAAQAGCSSLPPAPCHDGQPPRVVDHLYFGATFEGGEVSAQDWQAFLDGVVTPRFPRGLSVWSVAGQWQNARGVLIRQPAYVLNLVHEPGPVSEAAIAELVARYKARFRQESVLRVRSTACVSF